MPILTVGEVKRTDRTPLKQQQRAYVGFLVGKPLGNQRLKSWETVSLERNQIKDDGCMITLPFAFLL